MAERSFLLPIGSISDALESISELSVTAFLDLQRLSKSERSFSPDSDQLERFSSTYSLGSTDVQTILSILRFLYDRLSETTKTEAERIEAIKKLVADELENVSDADTEKLSDRLNQLLSISSFHDKYRKLSRLERGFLPSATSFRTLVDLRPEFNESASEISSFIPIVSLQIQTGSSNPALRLISVNIPLENVEALTKVVERMNLKLSTLKAKLASQNGEKL